MLILGLSVVSRECTAVFCMKKSKRRNGIKPNLHKKQTPQNSDVYEDGEDMRMKTNMNTKTTKR